VGSAVVIPVPIDVTCVPIAVFAVVPVHAAVLAVAFPVIAPRPSWSWGASCC
jgi:hypothetical protein